MSKTFLEALTSVGKNLQSGIDKLNETKLHYTLFNGFTSDVKAGGNYSSFLKQIEITSAPWMSDMSGEFKLTDTILHGDGMEITFYSMTGTVTAEFNNVTFDGVNMVLYEAGEYTFKNCTFKNCKYSPIDIKIAGITLTVEDCVFKDVFPDLTEWNANENSVRAWRYNPVNIRGNNANVKIKRCYMENIMSAHFIYIPRAITGCHIEVSESSFINGWGNGIAIEPSASGLIEKCFFKGMGALKGYGEYGYTLTGVGCNAIYSELLYNDIDVLDNYIIDVAENGIEGVYKSIQRNHIENTGYRYDEGFTTPSTEGIWGGAYIVSENTIINPYTYGIVIQLGSSLGKTINIIKNKFVDYENGNSCIRFVVERDKFTGECHCTENTVEGFANAYEIINNDNLQLSNMYISDNNTSKTIGTVLNKLVGVEFHSIREHVLPIVNPNFRYVDDSSVLTGWNKNNATLVRSVGDDGDAYCTVTMNNQYGSINQVMELPNDTCILTVKFEAKSSLGYVNLYVLCKDDNNTTVPSGDGGVYSIYKIPISVGTDVYTKKTVTIKAKKNTEIGFYAYESGQIIDIKNFSGTYFVDDGTLS